MQKISLSLNVSLFLKPDSVYTGYRNHASYNHASYYYASYNHASYKDDNTFWLFRLLPDK